MRSRRTTTSSRAAAAAGFALALLAPQALAEPGKDEIGAKTAQASSGGVVAPGQPQVEDVHCLTRCVSGHKATPGAALQVKGASLEYVRAVVFRGNDGPIRSAPLANDSGAVKARVPEGAISSRPYVVDFRGRQSKPSPNVLEVLPPSALPVEVFPIRGRHQYWDGIGAGRGHQGADIGAACGTRLVAALAGRVQYRAYHGAAGNYAVIDVRNSDVDLVYMHMIRPALVRPGQAVSAGQTIGYVGETGNASGCHLHFEYWRGDWYGGGSPIDPMPYLKAWDRKS